MAALNRIDDHGIIGDGRSMALVARDGSLDWLCWPRFDSDATLGALLHDESAGIWKMHPSGDWRSEQHYLPDTNVLVTRFERAEARVEIIDLMPVASEEESQGLLLPEHELIRIVECKEGEAELEVAVHLAPGFGAQRYHLEDRGCWGLLAETRSGAFFLRSERPLAWREGRAVGVFRLRAGDRVRLSLIWSPEGPAVLPPLADGCEAALRRTCRFWSSWGQRARYTGPFQEAVHRSALILKLLQYPPSGAFLAAGTTSLPERLGGALNWDYRFCWLRDAAFIVRSLYGLGYRDEAEAFVFWLLHTTRLTQPRLTVLYDVYGNSPGTERIIAHLDGYEGARPVRVGNAAENQLQLDLHGEVINAVCAYVDNGGELDRETRRMLVKFGDYVASNWRRPDSSLWEDRSEPRHYTHSKVLCWVALDGLLRLHRKGVLPELDPSTTRAGRELIRDTIQSKALNHRTGGYASELGGSEPDAALLLLSRYGFEPASSIRMRRTLDDVLRELGTGDGLLFRNRWLREQGDGAFVACSFWGVELVADGAGSFSDAEEWFQGLVARATPLGLYAEELHPESGHALGNFPQAFSHVGLISAALALEERRRSEPRPRWFRPLPFRSEEGHA